MIKLLTLSFLICAISSIVVKSQDLAADSVRKVAIKDAKRFKLNSAQVNRVKKGIIPIESDIFKPSAESTKTVSLLVDSVYVRTYRLTAYQRVVNSKTDAHYILVGVGITAALLFTITLVAFGAASK